MPDYKGNNSLMRASFYGFVDIVRLLLQYQANLDDQDIKGRTALMEACSSGMLL